MGDKEVSKECDLNCTAEISDSTPPKQETILNENKGSIESPESYSGKRDTDSADYGSSISEESSDPPYTGSSAPVTRRFSSSESETDDLAISLLLRQANQEWRSKLSTEQGPTSSLPKQFRETPSPSFLQPFDTMRDYKKFPTNLMGSIQESHDLRLMKPFPFRSSYWSFVKGNEETLIKKAVCIPSSSALKTTTIPNEDLRNRPSPSSSVPSPTDNPTSPKDDGEVLHRLIEHAEESVDPD